MNSTIFKASLKINNRALAQALEKKKSECRAAEAFILQQKEEIQMLTAEVNKGRMIAEVFNKTSMSVGKLMWITCYVNSVFSSFVLVFLIGSEQRQVFEL